MGLFYFLISSGSEKCIKVSDATKFWPKFGFWTCFGCNWNQRAFRSKLFEFPRLYFATAERWVSSVQKNWNATSCFLDQNNCLILWKWLKIVKIYPNVSNILIKVTRNLLLDEIFVFIKARENSNSFGRSGKMSFRCITKRLVLEMTKRVTKQIISSLFKVISKCIKRFYFRTLMQQRMTLRFLNNWEEKRKCPDKSVMKPPSDDFATSFCEYNVD